MLSLTRSHSLAGVWARSIVFMYKNKMPFSSLIVAYRLFANGQAYLSHLPVTLNSFLQNLSVFVLPKFVIVYSHSKKILDFKGAKVLVNDAPNDLPFVSLRRLKKKSVPNRPAFKRWADTKFFAIF